MYSVTSCNNTTISKNDNAVLISLHVIFNMCSAVDQDAGYRKVSVSAVTLIKKSRKTKHEYVDSVSNSSLHESGRRVPRWWDITAGWV
jgi:molybdenum cofactor biosynthesis enzyme